MDWYVPNEHATASRLRTEFARYIERHAEPGSDLDAAKLIFSELVTNAVENSDQPVWVSLNWGGERPVLTVNDLGRGFELDDDIEMPNAESNRGRGLVIVTHLTDRLEVAAKAAGGSRVTATLPIRRPPSPSFDPVELDLGRLLPDPAEADENGQFGRESFLLSLVVQLAQAVERQAGPSAAEALVAEVGTGVGYRMEEAFRRVRNHAGGPLTVDEMAALFVHLKAGSRATSS